MNISANKILGSIIYRTRQALLNNSSFLDQLNNYYYSKTIILDGKINLWHYPGTPEEISSILLAIGKHIKGSSLKFPSILNIHPIKQERYSNVTDVFFNLAFIAPVLNEWTTEEREQQVFTYVLRPIYTEFFTQINKSSYFNLGFGIPAHTYYEVFTTGSTSGVLLERYGDFIDAIEVHNLKLSIKPLCPKQLECIELENSRVTENIKEIIKS